MKNLLLALQAVLWSFIGLGGRRADADVRTQSVGILSLVTVALVVTLIIIVGLVALAHLAAGP